MCKVNMVDGSVVLPAVQSKPSWSERLHDKVGSLAKSHHIYFACKECCQKEQENPGSVNFQERGIRILEAPKNPSKGKAEGTAGGSWDIFDICLCPVRALCGIITLVVCAILCCPCLVVAGSVLSSIGSSAAAADKDY